MKKWTFWEIWKLLGDIEGWEKMASASSDRVKHKKQGINFYLFPAADFLDKNGILIFEANLFCYLFMLPRIRKIRKHLRIES